MPFNRREFFRAGVIGAVLFASQGLSAVFSDSARAEAVQESVVVDYAGPDSVEAVEKQIKELSKKMPAFIMLASPSCGYCNVLSGTFEKAARDLSLPVKVLRVDVDEFPAIRNGLRFKRVTPDTRAYENGIQKYGFVGAAPYENVANGLREMSAAIQRNGAKPAP